MRGLWLFQCNPDLFRIDDFLSNYTSIPWAVNQEYFAPRMHVGDTVFIWRAAGRTKKEAGIIAQAEIKSAPKIAAEAPEILSYWTEPETAVPQMRVELEIVRRAGPRETLKREWFKEDPILRNLLILRMANQTNYWVDGQEALRIMSLWRHTGRNWSDAEAIAGLWAYHRTFGLPVSKLPESVVARVSVRIGRAVTGVYSKVMNFKALDPRAVAEGLSGASDTDRMVWNRFYNESDRSIDGTRLETAFLEHWGPLELTEGQPNNDVEGGDVTPSASVPKQVRRAGQGFMRDSQRKLAIESCAMLAAKRYFGERDYEVIDVSGYEPFDLLCRKGSSEVHVEVKGTTSSGEKVFLTKNEVRHARAHSEDMVLFVVHGISLVDSPDGPQAIGGTFRILENWLPTEVDLTPETYSYRVPC
jgi:hypothetical protein